MSGLSQIEKSRQRNAKQQERERIRANKQQERDQIARAREAQRLKKEQSKLEKQRYIALRNSEADAANEALDAVRVEYENILAATLDVDDFFDLNNLKKSDQTHPFTDTQLEKAISTPKAPTPIDKPEYVEPKLPALTLFGRKRKRQSLIDVAKSEHKILSAQFEKRVERNRVRHEKAIAVHAESEAKRVESLQQALQQHASEIVAHNEQIDQFISFLAYGDQGAVEDYIKIVLENSVYPEGFDVSHEVSFEPSLAELCLKVSVSAPDAFPTTKALKYVQTRDEVTESSLSKAELKRRYLGAIQQVALRTAHEVFESDRSEIIKFVSVTVGTQTVDPAVGHEKFITFLGLTSERASFNEIKLGAVEPAATLKHLKAAFSKNPYELIEVDVSGIRKSK